MSKVSVAPDNIDLKRGIDHIGLSAASIIHDGKGRLLLMKRGAKARDENGRWDICGGAVEFGETMEEAVKREVKEELCTKALDVKFLGAYDAHRVHDGKQTHWIALVHGVRVNPKNVKIGEPDKIDEIGWFTTKDLPAPLHSMFDKAILEAKRHNLIK